MEEPEWYNEGFKRLKETQSAEGSWSDSSGQACADGLLRTFFVAVDAEEHCRKLGRRNPLGGRGLPRDLSKVKLRGGRLVVDQKPTEVDQLLGMLDESNSSSLDDLLDNPAALDVHNVDAQDARRLQQVVKSGPAGARIMAVREECGEAPRYRLLAPTLIYALQPTPNNRRRPRGGATG